MVQNTAATVQVTADYAGNIEEQDLKKIAWIRRRGALRVLIGGIMTGIVLILVIISIFWTPFDPNATSLVDRLAEPSFFGTGSPYPLGADQLGRDILSRIMAGGQVSLSIALIALCGTTVLGAAAGILSGYYRGAVDYAFDMFAEMKSSMPMMLLMIVFLAILGPSIIAMAVILALSEWVAIFRTTRAKTIVEKNQDYVLAGKAMGASNARIMFKYLLPNVLPSITVLAMLLIGTIILTEASLSYLGMGVERPFPSWGRMISDGQSYMSSAWWVPVFPALTIAFLAMGINILGDGLRQMMKME